MCLYVLVHVCNINEQISLYSPNLTSLLLYLSLVFSVSLSCSHTHINPCLSFSYTHTATKTHILFLSLSLSLEYNVHDPVCTHHMVHMDGKKYPNTARRCVFVCLSIWCILDGVCVYGCVFVSECVHACVARDSPVGFRWQLACRSCGGLTALTGGLPAQSVPG